MRFVKKHSEQKIIEIPENFSTLLSIDTDEKTNETVFNYKIVFHIDPVKLIRKKITAAHLEISKKPFSIIETKLNSNITDISENILLKNQQQKNITRIEKKKNLISNFILDLTNQIPNDQVANLSKKSSNSDTIIKKQIVSLPISLDEIKDKNISVPILDVNLNNLRDKSFSDIKTNNSDIKIMSENLIYTSGIDPAQFVGEKTETFLPAKRSHDGLTMSDKFKSHKRKQTQKPKEERTLINSLLSARQRNNSDELSNNETINVIQKQNIEKIVVEKYVSISVSKLQDVNFYVIIKLKNNRGINEETVSQIVEHTNNVQKAQIPILPPSIKLLNNEQINEVILELKQNDPNATKIRIYKKEFKKALSNPNSSYSLVGEIEATKDTGSILLRDPHVSVEPTIYRAICVNDNEIMCSDFSSVVHKNPSSASFLARYNINNKKPYFVSIYPKIADYGIIVNLKNIPTGPISLELLKKDKTNYSKTYKRVGTPIFLYENMGNNIDIIDSEVQSNRIYEYKVKFLYKDGSYQFSSTEAIIKYVPITNNILTVNTTPVVINNSGDTIDASFTITKDVNQTDTGKIKSFLASQGYLGEFQDEITNNRELLGKLFGIQVQRFNVTTSELEDYGIIDSDEFLDSRFGNPKGVKPLEPGNEYKYILTVFARDIVSLLPTYETTVTSETTNSSYTFKPYKWRNPVALFDGNIVSDETLSRNHAESLFTLGNVVAIKEIDVSLVDLLPSVTECKASKNGENSILVQWKAQGNVHKIDHFIIVMEILGIRTIVGKCHNISNSNYFQFIDKLTNNESGAITYFIVPVLYDYNRGTESKTNQVVI